MRNFKTIIPFAFVVCLFLMASCKSDDGGGGGGETPEEAALAKLQGTWDLSSATRDGNNILADYADMQVVISNKNLSAPNAPAESIFPVGSFTFQDDNYNTIIVNDSNQGSVVVSLIGSNDTTLKTSFSLDEDGMDASARVQIIGGDYIFTFTK